MATFPKSMEITDMAKGRLISARIGQNTTGMYVKIHEPLDIISAMHGVDIAYARGFSPEYILLKEGLPYPEEIINLAAESPDTRVYTVFHRRGSKDASYVLNEYSDNRSENPMPAVSNLVMKEANRQQMGILSRISGIEESDMMALDNPDIETINFLRSLNNYPIEQKIIIR